MRLMLNHGVFYEFLPFGGNKKETLLIDEVEIGEPYSMIISTNAGLWRYEIGDIVTFTSKDPYRIVINGRTKSCINLCGEELMVGNAEKAIKNACDITHARAVEFTAGPIFLTEKEAGGHEWIVEFEKKPNDMDVFTHTLDENLKALNSDYEAKRAGGILLNMPKVHAVKQGTFYEWMKFGNRLGGQNKIPRLSDTREYILALRSFSEVGEKIN